MNKIILNSNKGLKITNMLILEMYLGKGTDIKSLYFKCKTI